MNFHPSSTKLSRHVRWLAAASAILCQSALAVDCASPRWVSAWAAAPSDASPIVINSDLSINIPVGSNQSYREVFSPLGHGETLRLKFSNRYSKSPLVIKTALLARQTVGASIDPATLTAIRFNNGQMSVSVPAGQEILTDPVNFTFNSFDKLTVSIAIGVTGLGFVPTAHFTGQETSYVSPPGTGDHTADIEGGAYSIQTTRRHILTGMEALAPPKTGVVVTLGDSITDGYRSVIGANQRYPDFLKRRLDAEGLPFFVANAGISGNRVVSDGVLPQFGPSALSRYNADVLQQSGVSDVILLEGVNDIGYDFLKPLNYWIEYYRIIGGYQTLIRNMQLRGIKVMQGTLTPTGYSDRPFSFYNGFLARQLRQDINWWIRKKSPADTIVDFDAAVRSPANPDVIDPRYNSDGLHFNGEGYARMAAAVDLNRLQGSVCRR